MNRNGFAAIAVTISLLASSHLMAQGRIFKWRKRGNDCCDCYKGKWQHQDCVPYSIKPSDPNKMTDPMTDPSTDPNAEVDNLINDDLFSGQGMDLASAGGDSGSFVPNMFGDQFSGSSGGTIIASMIPGQLNGLPVDLAITGSFDPMVVTATNQVNFPGPVSIDVITAQFGTIFTALAGINIDQGISAGTPPVPFDPNSQVISDVNAVLLAAQPLIIQQLNSIEAGLPNAIAGSSVVDGGFQIDQSPGSGTWDGNSLIYLATVRSILQLDIPILIPIVNPAGGGAVGRIKIADDNNPLPRDRFIFNYDYFNNVPLTPDGWDVTRFAPGFEKTFFDGLTSIEAIFPFASTLNSDFTQGMESSNTEFGNILLKFKGLLYNTEKLAVAGGLGVSLPTADDTNVSLANGVELVRIENEAVLLAPFMAAVVQPNKRLFSQFWAALNFDSNGNPVFSNTLLTGMQNAGQIQLQTLLQLDAQIGYWMYQSDYGALRGIAPFIEMHYNTTLNDADIINSGGILIGDLAGNIDELNMSIGATTLIGDNLNISTGLVVPLKTGSDRFFDYQIGVHTNWLFGGSARRNSIYRTSTF